MRVVGWIGVIILGLGVLWLAVFAINIISLPFHAASNTVDTVHGVIDRTMNADNALMQYRWFHDADGRLKAFPSQIEDAKEALTYAEAHAPDDVENRETELTGIKQVCQSLVEDYNARAQRIDAGFFRNPERFLPVAAAPWEPLPQVYGLSTCNGVTK